MNKNSKKHIKNCLLLYALCSMLLVTNDVYAQAYLQNSNEFIKVVCNKSTSKFWLYTTGGNPEISSDDNKKLLYHAEGGGETSYTTIKIDDKNWVFGEGRNNSNTVIEDGNSIVSSWVGSDKIKVEQRIFIVKGPTTNNSDTLKIEYTITNLSIEPHKVGLRILLDTYLGNNDGAPFSVPGLGSVTTDTALTSDRIPDYWYVFDNLSEPTVSAMGMLHLLGYIEPDKVVFSNWRRLFDSMWDINLKSGRIFRVFLGGLDSACAIYWNPVVFNPGQVKKYGITYGIYKPTIKLGDAINVAIGCPERVRENMPFTVCCDIENKSGEYPLDSVEITLVLPEGVSLADTETDSLKKVITRLSPKEITKAFWNLRLKGTNLEKAVFSVKVNGKIQQDNFSVKVQSSTPNVEIPPLISDNFSIKSPESIIPEKILLPQKTENACIEKVTKEVILSEAKNLLPTKSEMLHCVQHEKTKISQQAQIKKISVDKEISVIPTIESEKFKSINNNIVHLTKKVEEINSNIDKLNSKLEKIKIRRNLCQKF
ncbi:MAG: hypothetical protein AB1349_08935 [Elusimicrobiota bacterium]